MIPRLIENLILKSLKRNREVILISGARQVGKTTVLKNLETQLIKIGKRILYLNCDTSENRNQIDTTSLTILSKLTNKIDCIIIDEAQRLTNPGLTLKIIHDELPSVRVLASGSSSLDLKNRLSDALTGRLIPFSLYPLSLSEVTNGNATQMRYLLSQALITGLYPKAYLKNKLEDKEEVITRIIDGYLFKDILEFDKVRQPILIKDLVTALAYQIGSEVNENELANRLKVNRRTVINYIDLLEKTFVIIRLYPLSRNPRREIGRKYKIYFTDIGIRNALIGDFNRPEIRRDFGHMWENFLFMERVKKYAYMAKPMRYYFWRTYGGTEVDYIEQELTHAGFHAFEFKYSTSKLSRGAQSFRKEYGIPVTIIHKENFAEFV